MEWLRRFRFRVRGLWRDAALEAEMAEEMRAHLERLEAANRDAGLSPEAARSAALRQFGNIASVQERARDEWRFRSLEHVIKDLHYARRSLRGSPVFAIAVIGSLILGIGANVTVLTLMRAALWRPLPLNHPEQIVHVRRVNPASTSGAESSSSYVLFQQLRESAAPAAQIIAKTSARQRRFGLDPSSKERVIGEAVSDDFFAVLGVQPAVGRLFVAGDDGPGGGQRIAVLSDRFWKTRFDADPAVVGRTIYYDESPFTVVGVAAPGFDGVDAERHVQVWIPVTADVAITPLWLRNSSFHWLTLLARLPSPSSAPALEHQLDARFRTHVETELLPDMSPRFRSMFGGEHLELRPAAAGLATTGRRYEPQLRVLAGVAFCLFLICCANVANLVRARNARRQDEFALRRALGASSPRILQQLLVEGLLLGMIGVLGSLLAAPWIAGALLGLLPTNPPLAFDLKPDLVILTIAAALGVASTVAAITVPAWRQGMRHTPLNAAERMTGRLVVSRATIAVQLATVLVLLVVAGMTLSMLRQFSAIELGFDPTSVTSVELSFPRGTSGGRVAATLEGVRQRLEASEAVESASYAFPTVYDTGGTSMAVVPTDYAPAPGEDTQAGILEIGPGFFATLHIAVHQGRTFTSADLTPGTPLVVVNETFARKYFAGRTAIGQSVRIPGRPQPTVATIVGIVGDVRHYGVRAEPWPMVYRPGAAPGARLFVRVRQPGSALIRSAIAAVDATAQIESVRPLREIVATMISRERLLAVLSSVIAMVAITLAALGLYGIVAYGVTCRRAEFAIRLALGAQRTDIRRLVLNGTLKIVVMGLVAGMAAAFAASRLVSRVVPDIPTLNWPLVFGAALVLVAVMMLAAWVPAWRAASTDPALTLRYQ
jgi:putative ABC transport system permease protein